MIYTPQKERFYWNI